MTEMEALVFVVACFLGAILLGQILIVSRISGIVNVAREAKDKATESVNMCSRNSNSIRMAEDEASELRSFLFPSKTTEKCKKCDGRGFTEKTVDAPLVAAIRNAVKNA